MDAHTPVQEIPFDSDRKRMTTIHRGDGAGDGPPGSSFTYPHLVAFVKGAPDIILDLCHRIQRGGQAVPLTEEQRRRCWNRTMTWPATPSGSWGSPIGRCRSIRTAYHPEDIETDLGAASSACSASIKTSPGKMP